MSEKIDGVDAIQQIDFEVNLLKLTLTVSYESRSHMCMFIRGFSVSAENSNILGNHLFKRLFGY